MYTIYIHLLFLTIIVTFSVQYCYIFSFLYIYSKYSSLRGGEASFHFLCACTPCRSILCFIICLLFCSWEMKIFDFSLSSINILVSGQHYVKYGQNLDCHSCFATHLQLLHLKIGGLCDFNFGEIYFFSTKQIIADNFVFSAIQLF